MTASFIMPTMWRSNKTPALLDALRDGLASEVITEVIIIDNDPTARPAAISLHGFQVLAQPENIGVNPAWNLGVQEATGDLIALCNDDLSFDACRWWPTLATKLRSSPGAIIGLHPMGFNRTAEHLGEDAGLIRRGHQLGLGWGCLLAMRRQEYPEVPDGLVVWYGDNWLAKHLEPHAFVLPCAFEASATVQSAEFSHWLAADHKRAEALGLLGAVDTDLALPNLLLPHHQPALERGFQQAFFANRSAAEWRWRYHRPWAPSLQQVAPNEAGDLAAHVGWTIDRAQIQGLPVLCAQGGDMFRLPGLAGGDVSLIPNLIRDMFHLVDRRPNIAWTYGFQTPRLRARNDRLFRFEINQALPLHVISTRPQPWWRPAKRVARLDAVAEEQQAIDDLWLRSAHRYFVSIVRDGAWFAYRYDAHPARSYRHLGLRNREGSWAVWATLGERLGEAMLVDLVWDGEDPRALRAVLQAARDEAFHAGHQHLTAWLLGDPAALREMDAMGWRSTPDPQSIGVTLRHSHPALHRSDFPLRHFVMAGYSDLV